MGTGCRLHTLSSSLQYRSIPEKYNITAKYVLSYVGRIAPEKDIDMLQNLIVKSAHTRNDIHWLIAGDGPLATSLREAVPKTNVTFTGYLQGVDLAEAYACSNMMVFPSATETFGNVVLESLACGTPVIGANSGGVKILLQMEKREFFARQKMRTHFYHPFIFIAK